MITQLQINGSGFLEIAIGQKTAIGAPVLFIWLRCVKMELFLSDEGHWTEILTPVT